MISRVYTYNSVSDLERHIPKNSGIFIIIDNKVAEKWGKPLECPTIEVEADERCKSLDEAARICGRLMEYGADRECFILGVGGGVTTDMAGFVASVYKRGVNFGFVPTTLLAQCDAAIGGKNGVNLMGFKNIIGTIRQPSFVYETPGYLKTLPPRVFKEGIAEILKTFAIFDTGYFRKAVSFFGETDHTSMSAAQEGTLADIIGKCAGYKSEVVAADEFEKGGRRLLNFGHTFAHAIEKHCIDHPENGIMMHGEAVACGMVLAAKIAFAAGKCSGSCVEEITGAVIEAGLPAECGIDTAVLARIIKSDKKVSGDSIHFIMPYAVGDIRDELIGLDELYGLAGRIQSRKI